MCILSVLLKDYIAPNEKIQFLYADRNDGDENANLLNYYAGPIYITFQPWDETITFETSLQ